MRTALWLTLLVVAVLSACASPPNTPGEGVGKNYTPIIDYRGVDQARYFNDLDACRNSAGMIDADRQELMGLIGGALIGAAYGASISNNRQVIGAGANSGAMTGGLRAGANARSRQAIVMGNCMASRGYRVLDGTAQVSYTVPLGSMPAPAAPPPAMPPAVQPSPAMPSAPSAPPTIQPTVYVGSGLVTLPTGVGNPAPPVEPTGKDAYVAERLARQLKCNDTSLAKLVGKGAGYESYSMACTNGETLLMRCEFGNCRALK